MNKDDFNKTPDNTNDNIKDKELTDILKRLSEILDTSVSLQDAIDLVKRKQAEEEALKKQEEQVNFFFSESETDTKDEPTKEVEKESADSEEEAVSYEEDNSHAEEVVFETETVTAEEKSNSVPDFSDYANFMINEEEPEEQNNSSEDLSFVIPQKEKEEEENKEEPVFEFSLNDSNEDSETKETTEEDNSTSKIFDELLACFENRKLPDDFRFSSLQDYLTKQEEASKEQTAEEESVIEETTEDSVSNDTETEQITENTDVQEEQNTFTPIYHQSPDEDDEIFSQIFYEAKKDRKNKERDKKKWQKTSGDGTAFLRGFFDWVEIVVLSSALALLIFTFVMRLAVVDGDSMNNTLHDKELLVISDLMYEPKNNDIIVFNAPSYSKEPIVKRIIATEGQTVDIDFENWIVTVDGVQLKEDYVKKLPQYMKSSDMQFPLTVPEGFLFVMGDNRNDSLDSRDSRIGLVDERFVLGAVKFRLSPLNKFGKVK